MPINLSELFITQIGKVEICTDSREFTEENSSGKFFLPIRGEKFDGHEFIGAVLKTGAAGSFCEQASLKRVLENLKAQSKELGMNPGELEGKIIPIEDSLKTYHKIANHYRKQVNPKVIAITGSSGKTTTKEMLAGILEEKFKTHKSHANFNNEIGVPKTILEMPSDTEVLILEMGMRGFGEISLLSQTAEPDYAIITNIGSAHIEKLGSKENIEKAKLEIIDGLKNGDLLVLDESFFQTLQERALLRNKNSKEEIPLIGASGKSFEHREKTLRLKTFDSELNYAIEGLLGPEIASDLNAAAVIAKELGLSEEEISNGSKKYKALRGRGSFHYDKEGNLFIDDSYNANPESMRASLNALMKSFPNKDKIAVLGLILESDENLVDETFKYAHALANDPSNRLELLDARTLSLEETEEKLKDLLEKSTRNQSILVKGSRLAKLEEIIEKHCKPEVII